MKLSPAWMGRCRRSAKPLHHQARRGFTLADQVDQLVGASESGPRSAAFMARTMALCSLPRSNPRDRLRYVRRNGPYTLVMNAGGLYKLPFGHLPRLLMAWISTEAVRTQSRVLVLGDSLSEFMRALDIYSSDGKAYTRLRNQMDRLFHASVRVELRRQTRETVHCLCASLTGVTFGGTRSGPMSGCCGTARSGSARISSTRSSATRCRST